jgi:hypothetical protein
MMTAVSGRVGGCLGVGEKIVEEDEAGDGVAVVEEGEVADLAVRHDREHLVAGGGVGEPDGFGVDGVVLSSEELVGGAVEGSAREDGAADVTVGEGAEEGAVVGSDDEDADPAFVESTDGVGHWEAARDASTIEGIGLDGGLVHADLSADSGGVVDENGVWGPLSGLLSDGPGYPE